MLSCYVAIVGRKITTLGHIDPRFIGSGIEEIPFLVGAVHKAEFEQAGIEASRAVLLCGRTSCLPRLPHRPPPARANSIMWAYL